MNEQEVYRAAKRWFKEHDFLILGGQPPGGTDHHPVIEIKDEIGNVRGSRSAFKPDLLVCNENFFGIVEIKPDYSQQDHDKLELILNSNLRLANLFEELLSRSILKRNGLGDTYPNINTFISKTVGVLAYSGLPERDELCYQLVFNDEHSHGVWLPPKR
jgi:hypothetical protein